MNATAALTPVKRRNLHAAAGPRAAMGISVSAVSVFPLQAAMPAAYPDDHAHWKL